MKNGETYTIQGRNGKIVEYEYLTGDEVRVVFSADDFDIPELQSSGAIPSVKTRKS